MAAEAVAVSEADDDDDDEGVNWEAVRTPQQPALLQPAAVSCPPPPVEG